MTKPKVLVISALGPPPYVGGIENVIDTLLKSNLTQRYIFTTFDTYRVPNPERSVLSKVFFAMNLFFRCLKIAYSFKAQIAHIHFCSKTDFWKHTICLFACKLLGIKTIFHLHGGSFDQFYNNENGFWKLLIRFVLRRANTLIALSKYWQEFLSNLAPKSDILVLPNPIDCILLKSFVSDNSFVKLSIVMLGSLGKRKGHYDVLKAIPLVLACHPNAHFYFAGLDEDYGATEDLIKLAENNNISGNVHFLGPVSGQSKLKLLGEASIVILPSYGENMPISILEGMAVGKAIITTSVGAIPEFITDNENGMLIQPGDWQALAQNINFLFEHTDFAKQLGRQASSMALANWDISKIVLLVDDLYMNML
jgi:glycosyltransferase involved in cell wall biosynthesis